MTGFGTSQISNKNFDIDFNIKSTNNRFFDFKIKLPQSLSFMEKDIYECVKKECVRGSIQIYCKLKINYDQLDVFNINNKKLDHFYNSFSFIDQKFDKGNFKLNLSFDSLLNYLGNDNNDLLIKNQKKIYSVFNLALKDLLKSRIIEGKKLEKEIKLNIKKMEKIHKEVVKLEKINKKQHFQNLKNRVNNLLNNSNYNLDDENLYKELAIYSDKYDISEETSRINSHLKQFDLYINDNQFLGKKINFLCQEFFREINTIGSKSNNKDISFLVIDFKTSLEKIREQIQNIL